MPNIPLFGCLLIKAPNQNAHLDTRRHEYLKKSFHPYIIWQKKSTPSSIPPSHSIEEEKSRLPFQRPGNGNFGSTLPKGMLVQKINKFSIFHNLHVRISLM